MDSGRVEVKITGYLTRDYQNQFNTSKLRQKLRGIYNKWMLQPRIDKYEGRIVEFCDAFVDSAKKFLEIEGKK